MADKPDLTLPAYQIALNAEQLALLGVFCAIWSQIDYFSGLTIAGLLKTEIAAAEMFMENMTTGPRINFLRRLSSKIGDDDLKTSVKSFCKDMGALIDDRNHLLHGMWGWQTAKEPKDMVAASFYPKRSDAPIAASELLVLCNRAAEQSHAIVKIQRAVYGIDLAPAPGEKPPGFYFGGDAPPGM